MNILGVMSLNESSILIEIVIIIILATIFAYISKLIKQPLIPAYILTGILLGPIFLGLVKDTNVIRQLSEFGITFLLFIVGLEINIKKLKDIGLVSVVVGLSQVIIIYFSGYFLSKYLGFSSLTSVYIGLVITLSSTMIVVKLLSDKKRMDTLDGRLVLGILLIQDLVIISILPFLSTLNKLSHMTIINSIFNIVILVLTAILLSIYIFPKLFSYAARSNELLFLVSLTVCFSFVILAYLMNFSISIGAFIAGISLGNLPYNREIMGRILSLKDFFAVIFFVFLGAQLVLLTDPSLIQAMILFLLLIIILKPFIIFITTLLFGYDRRISFLTGMSLGQVSEFSLILAAQGLFLGHISKEIFSLTIMLTIITMVYTSYTIKYDNTIYNKLSWFLRLFEKISPKKKKFEYAASKKKKKIIIFGCHRMGSVFVKALKKIQKDILIVDHNPEVIKELMKEKIPCLYGDINNLEVLESLDIKNASFIISTIPESEGNEFLIGYAKSINPKVKIFVTSDQVKDAFDLYDYGADYVILPHLTTAELLSKLLKEAIKNHRSIDKLREEHLDYIESLKWYGK